MSMDANNSSAGAAANYWRKRFTSSVLRKSRDGRSEGLLLTFGIITGAAVIGRWAQGSVSTATIESANFWIPVLIFGACLVNVLRMLKAQTAYVWAPMFWFLVTCIPYYGFGPLVYLFGEADSIEYIEQLYSINDEELLRTNILNALGIALVIVGYFVGTGLFGRTKAGRKPKEVSEVGVERAVVLFLLVGIPAKYGLYLPHIFGLLGYTPPAIFMQLQHCVALSIVLMMLLIGRGRLRWVPVLLLVIFSESISAALEFTKLTPILTLIMLILGFQLVRPRKIIYLLGVTLTIGLYIVLNPYVSYCRGVIVDRYDNHYTAGLGERYEIATSYFTSFVGTSAQSIEPQGWWTRLNFANVEAFAMNAYDEGIPGDSFQAAAYVFVPRVFWRDKPAISEIAFTFNSLLTGSEKTANGPGIFGEAYWNYGWPAVWGVGLYVGLLLSCFTKYSMEKMFRMEFWLLPVVFIGMKMGFRPDGWFVLEYIGPLGFAVVLHFMLTALFTFGQKQRDPASHVDAVRPVPSQRPI